MQIAPKANIIFQQKQFFCVKQNMRFKLLIYGRNSLDSTNSLVGDLLALIKSKM